MSQFTASTEVVRHTQHFSRPDIKGSSCQMNPLRIRGSIGNTCMIGAKVFISPGQNYSHLSESDCNFPHESLIYHTSKRQALTCCDVGITGKPGNVLLNRGCWLCLFTVWVLHVGLERCCSLEVDLYVL